MKARKVSFAVLACCIAAFAVAASPAASSGRQGAAKTRTTIYPWPDGLFGYVKSSKSARCASHRPVAVFQQKGKRKHPRNDRRIDSVRAKRKHGFYQWSVKTPRTGRFYAKAKRRPGCRPDLSRSLRVRPGTTGSGTNAGTYPPCGPYVGEAGASVCRYDQLHFTMKGSCTFGDTDDCSASPQSGLFPWARLGNGDLLTSAHFFWNWSNHNVLFVAFRPGQGPGVAHLGGTVPSPNSARYTITDGFAQNDLGYPNGQHFYTPDLPGQEAGEPGGPLYLNFDNGNFSTPTHVYVHGYLYVCPSDQACGG